MQVTPKDPRTKPGSNFQTVSKRLSETSEGQARRIRPRAGRPENRAHLLRYRRARSCRRPTIPRPVIFKQPLRAAFKDVAPVDRQVAGAGALRPKRRDRRRAWRRRRGGRGRRVPPCSRADLPVRAPRRPALRIAGRRGGRSAPGRSARPRREGRGTAPGRRGKDQRRVAMKPIVAAVTPLPSSLRPGTPSRPKGQAESLAVSTAAWAKGGPMRAARARDRPMRAARARGEPVRAAAKTAGPIRRIRAARPPPGANRMTSPAKRQEACLVETPAGWP